MSESKLPASLSAVPTVLAGPMAYPGAKYSSQPSAASAPAFEESDVPFSHYLWILRQHRYKIIAFVVLCVSGTFIVSSRLTSVYEATTTVDVDRQAPSGIVGQDAHPLNVVNDSDQYMATQIKLIQSDAVLRPVAEKYNLLEREKRIFDYQWASKEATANAPVLLRRLSVVRPPNTYLLLINYRSPDPKLAADVANAIADSYLEHNYSIRMRSSSSLATFMQKQLQELRAKMELSSGALLQFERDLNIVNPEEKTNILSARLLQLNSEYTTAQGDRVRKEVAFQSARLGTLEAAMISNQGEALKKLTERLNEAEQRFSQINEQYGVRHPEFRKADAEVKELRRQVDMARQSILKRVDLEYQEAARREDALRKAVMETKGEYDRINARSFEYQQLKREADADKKLYEELVSRIRESGINAGFQNNTIRLADLARPPVKPVFPNMRLNLALALLLSTVLAAGVAIASDVVDKSVRDPQQVTQILKTELLGSLPLIRGKELRARLAALANPPSDSEARTLLLSSDQAARNNSGNTDLTALTVFEESVRTLHSSILLSDFDRRIRSLLITSTAPGEGKSIIAAHLAIRHAAQGQRTLLIDADFRRPSLHRLFGISADTGLSSVLLEQAPWRNAVAKLEGHPNLDLIPAGAASERATDLVGRDLEALVREASCEYSMVVIDSPPSLSFAEPLRISTMVDGVLLVMLAGETNRQAAASALATLKRVRANVVGVVLNQVTEDLMDYYQYYGYHKKYYKSYYSTAHSD